MKFRVLLLRYSIFNNLTVLTPNGLEQTDAENHNHVQCLLFYCPVGLLGFVRMGSRRSPLLLSSYMTR